MKKKILLIDDDKDFCRLIFSVLKKLDVELIIVNRLKDAIIYIIKHNFDVILIDGYLPDGSGVDFVVYLHKKKIKSKIAFISGGYTGSDQYQWLKTDIGVDYVINKPIKPNEIFSIMKSLLNDDTESTVDDLLKDLKEDYDKTIFEKIKKLENLLRILEKEKNLGNLKNFRTEIHKITGSAGSYGYNSVTKIGRACDQELLKKVENKIPVNDKDIIRYKDVLSKFKLGFQNIDFIQEIDTSENKKLYKKDKKIIYKVPTDVFIYSEDANIIQNLNKIMKNTGILYRVFAEQSQFIANIKELSPRILLISKKFYSDNYETLLKMRKSEKIKIGIFLDDIDENWIIENVYKGFDFTIPDNDTLNLLPDFLLSYIIPAEENNLKVIVIDDDSVMLNYISNILEELSILFRKLVTVEELFKLLPIYHPDLIIIDLDSQNPDFLNKVKLLKSDIRYLNIPVITMRSNMKEYKLTDFLKYNLYLSIEKPISKDMFKLIMTNFLNQAEANNTFKCCNRNTRVLNRISFQKIFDKLINNAKREKKIFSLGLVEIQNLDEIEDIYGLAERGKAIVKFSKFLIKHFRKSDLIAHWRKNTFVILIEDTAIYLQFILGRFFDELQTSDLFKEFENHKIGLKAGISEYPKFGKNLNRLITSAEKALVDSKNDPNSVLKIIELKEDALVKNQEICLVDDDVDLRNMLSYSFATRGYKVCSFGNGNDFLSEIKRRSEVNLPKLIILDRELPDYDGMDIFKILKKELKFNIPVLFLSSKSTEKDIFNALEAGAVDYVTKPFSLKILLQKTLNLIISSSNV